MLSIAVVLVAVFWSSSIQTIFTDTVLVDGITQSVFLVSALTPALSLMSWILLSGITHRKIIVSGMLASVLIGLITITPIAQITGPILAIILGIISGCSLFGYEHWRKRD